MTSQSIKKHFTPNLNTWLMLIGLLGSIWTGASYFEGIKSTNEKQDIYIEAIQKQHTDYGLLEREQDAKIAKQDEAIFDVRSYIKYGVIPRLQLNEEEILRKAREMERFELTSKEQAALNAKSTP